MTPIDARRTRSVMSPVVEKHAQELAASFWEQPSPAEEPRQPAAATDQSDLEPTTSAGGSTAFDPSEFLKENPNIAGLESFVSGDPANPHKAEVANEFNLKLGELIQASEERNQKSLVTELDPKADRLYNELDEAIKAGKIDPRKGLGQRFQAEAQPGPEYKAMSHKMKEAYRMEWAQKKLTQLKETKTYRRDFSTIDSNVGVYLPPRRIITEEGGIWRRCKRWYATSRSARGWEVAGFIGTA